MGAIKDTIRNAVPWAAPLLDYFDWRKRVIAGAVAATLFAWSYVKGLPWPVIVVLALTTLVAVAYALVLPGLVRLVNVGVRETPNIEIWKHKKQFRLCETACLLAGVVPVYTEMGMSPDALAWFVQLIEAVNFREITPSLPPSPTRPLGLHTEVGREELRKFCDARQRSPEFLKD